jgi:hypothetical protein
MRGEGGRHRERCGLKAENRKALSRAHPFASQNRTHMVAHRQVRSGRSDVGDDYLR